MRRRAPRPLGSILPETLSGVRPATLLARVQAVWPEVAGRALAASTAPVAERGGVITVTCESSVWAQELELLQRELLERLAGRLAGSPEGSVERLRFTVGSLPNHP
ncbi:MAG TPA: DciA family protein [Thermoleophilaceae bacterium]|nr:DciA family protein [Thermoleophilaceae bacterium]